MKLHELSPAPGAVREVKRIGRGHGSGQGKTAGKGHKGQWARSGGGVRPGFEGGQTRLMMRIPKRGFNNKNFRTEYAEVNVSDLEARFENGAVIGADELIEKGLIKKVKDGVKILGNGEITKAVTVNAARFTKSAKEKIENAGGKANEIVPDEYVSVSLRELNESFSDGATVDAKAILDKNLVKEAKSGIIVTGKGDLKKKLTLTGVKCSKSAQAKIKRAGGKAGVV